MSRTLCNLMREHSDFKLQLDTTNKVLKRYRDGTNSSLLYPVSQSKKLYECAPTVREDTNIGDSCVGTKIRICVCNTRIRIVNE